MRLSTKAAFCSMWLLSCTVWSCGEYEEIALANDETVPTDAHLEVSYLDSECRLVERWSAPVSKLPVRLKVIASPIEAEGGRRIIALRSSLFPHKNQVESPADSTPKAITLKPVAPLLGKRVLEGVNTEAGVSNHFSVYVNPRAKEEPRWMIAGLQQPELERPKFIIATSDNKPMQLPTIGDPKIKAFSGFLYKDTITVIYSHENSKFQASCSRMSECTDSSTSEILSSSMMNSLDSIEDVSLLIPQNESDGNKFAHWRGKLPIDEYRLFSLPIFPSQAATVPTLALIAKSISSITPGTIQQTEPLDLFVGLKEMNDASAIKKFSMKTEGSAPELLHQETFSPQTEPTHLALGDADRDSHPDLIYSDGDTVFMRTISLPSPGEDQRIFINSGKAQQLALGDVNGDAILDLVLLSNRKVNVHLGTGDKQNMFDPVPSSEGALSVEAVEMHVADLDGDCRAEIIILDKAGNVFKHSVENPS